jgi:GT2 family glycosyltransferase
VRAEPEDAAGAPAPTLPIAVAISTLDRPDALARCLGSLAAGSALPAEVVVVDQSRDASARPVVEAAAAALPGVRHVPQRTIGLSVGQNEAVGQTGAAVVAVLDDDCVADENWIAQVARLLADDRPLDVIGGRVLPLGADAPGLYAVSSRPSTTPQTFDSRTRPWEVGSGNNFAFRRRWFDAIGGCDARLGPGAPGRGAADIDLFYRLLRAGARVGYEPGVLVYHERKMLSQRLARRVPYGFGMGAACAIWLRQRDRCALRVLANWLVLRLRLCAASLRRRHWLGVWEEVLVVTGTARGLVYGLRAPKPSP